MKSKDFKLIVILGKVLNPDGSPKDELVERCKLAAERAKADTTALIVTSGGDPKNIGVTEAAVMSRILQEQSVESQRIVLDELSKNTCENAYNTYSLVKKRCNPVQVAAITLVTSKYHMPRASWIFRVFAKAMQVRVSMELLEDQDMSGFLVEEKRLEERPKRIKQMLKKYNLQCDDIEDISRPRQELLLMKTSGVR